MESGKITLWSNDNLMERCIAKSKRSGEQCKNASVRGFPVCRFHGAGSKDKPGGRPITHGRYSSRLPERLAGRYGEALRDAKLFELRDEVALIGTRTGELVERIDTGESAQRWKALQMAYTNLKAATRSSDKGAFVAAMAALEVAIEAGGQDYQTWREIVELTEQRRKLSESERKYQIAAQQMITAERAMVLLAAVVDVIRRHVDDREVLSLISSELRALTMVDADV
jgi:hypothetical protein